MKYFYFPSQKGSWSWLRGVLKETKIGFRTSANRTQPAITGNHFSAKIKVKPYISFICLKTGKIRVNTPFNFVFRQFYCDCRKSIKDICRKGFVYSHFHTFVTLQRQISDNLYHRKLISYKYALSY